MTTKKRRKAKKSIPEWAARPFQTAREDINRLQQVVAISAHGIHRLQSLPKLVEATIKYDEALRNVDKDNSQDSAEEQARVEAEASERLASAQQEAELAIREVSEDFPVLHSWAVIGLWAQLEALIRTFLAAWLKHKRKSWEVEAVRKLRVRLGDYEAIHASQRAYFVVGLLERDVGAGLRAGVKRFEILLEIFGLSGPVPDPISRAIYELGQVRNLIAHNGARVDRQFNQACPWRRQKIGTPIQVTSEMLRLYIQATMLYLTLLVSRVGIEHGLDMSKHVRTVEASALELPFVAKKGKAAKRPSKKGD